MSNRSRLHGRWLWVVGSAFAGLLIALWLLRSTDVTRAQDGGATADVDPRWLAILAADRVAAESSSEVDAPTSGGLSLNVNVEDGLVSGFAPSGAKVLMTVQRTGSAPISMWADPAYTDAGWLYARQFWMYLPYGVYTVGFQPGDWVTVTQGSQTLSLTVPPLDALGFASTDVVTGQSQPGAALTAYVFPALDPAQSFTATTTANGAGAYQVDFGSITDLQPGDSGWVRQSFDASRTVAARIVVPQIHMQVGESRIAGYAAPRRALNIRLWEGGAPVTGVISLTTEADGAFDVCDTRCMDDQGGTLVLTPGQQVELSMPGQIVTATVPVLTAQVDLNGGTVFGSAAPSAQVSVDHQRGPINAMVDPFLVHFDPAAAVTATAGGQYSVPESFNPADFGIAVTRGADGHLGFVRYALPHLEVHLNRQAGEALLQGQTSVGSTPVTISVQGPSGLLKGQITAMSFANHALWISQYPFELTPFLIDSQDVLTIETRSGIDMVVPIPRLELRADVNAQRISGMAPPGTSVSLHLERVEPASTYPSGYDAVLTAGLDGTFALDLHDAVLVETSIATVRWVSPEGHVVIRSARTDQSCLQMIESITVGGNSVNFVYPPDLPSTCNQPQSVHLLAADGHEKGRAGFGDPYTYSNQVRLADTSGNPVRILSGDRLLVEAGSQQRSWVIPPLTVAANAAHTIVSGTASPGTVVTLSVDNAFDGMPFLTSQMTATADSGGHFSVPLTLSVGDLVEARLPADPGQPRFNAYAVDPGVTIPLYQQWLHMLLPPLESFTATLQTARPFVPPPFVGMTDDHGYVSGTGYPYYSGAYLWGIVPGDRLDVVAGGFSRQLVVPNLTARLEPAAHRIVGSAPPFHTLMVRPNPSLAPVTTTSDGAGQYTLVFPPDMPVNGIFTVLLATETGDWVSLDVAPVRWWVHVGANCVEVMLPSSLAQARLELRTGAGVLKSYVDDPLAFSAATTTWSACLPETPLGAIQSGDRLVLTTPSGSWTYDVPTLSAQHDPRRRVVTGMGPAGGVVTLSTLDGAWPWQSPIGRRVTVDGSGHYGMDVSDLDFLPGRAVFIAYSDPSGSVAVRALTWSGIQHWLPFVGHP